MTRYYDTVRSFMHRYISPVALDVRNAIHPSFDSVRQAWNACWRTETVKRTRYRVVCRSQPLSLTCTDYRILGRARCPPPVLGMYALRPASTKTSPARFCVGTRFHSKHAVRSCPLNCRLGTAWSLSGPARCAKGLGCGQAAVRPCTVNRRLDRLHILQAHSTDHTGGSGISQAQVRARRRVLPLAN